MSSLRSGLLLASATVLVACAGRDRAGDDQDAAVARDSAADADAHGDTVVDEPWPTHDSDIETPADVPECGDGELDPGEECDDGNRLDGDGCDWLCRAWDGARPPTVDPTVPDYAPAADGPASVEGPPLVFTYCNSLPVTWSGSDFASADARQSAPTHRISFYRFDREGTPLDSPWQYPDYHGTPCPDLAWTGEEYGLFWDDEGIRFLLLDSTGKPLGDPVLVVDDPGAGNIAVDTIPDGYALAWTQSVEESMMVGVRLVGPHGEVDGRPEVMLLPIPPRGGARRPRIATGTGGFGLAVGTRYAGARFLHLDADLAEVTTSGTLGEGRFADVVWDGDSYVVAWHRNREGTDMVEDAYLGSCVARFDVAGLLRGPPVCTMLSAEANEPGLMRLAAGDGGLALVYGLGYQLFFLRTDGAGVPLGPPRVVADFDRYSSLDAVGVTWADDAFAVLYSRMTGGLELRLFVRASP